MVQWDHGQRQRIWRQIMAEKNQHGWHLSAWLAPGGTDRKKTPRPLAHTMRWRKRRFFDHDISQRGIALSLAGLAATYSPRA
jgi:hypothetical protein